MSCFNRGEWSEFYTILALLLSPDLSIGDANLEEITHELYTLKKIKIENPISKEVIQYSLNSNSDVEIIYENEIKSLLSNKELDENKIIIFDAIKNDPTGNGSFEIKGIEEILNKILKGKKIKSKSFNKEDLEAIVIDKHIGKDVSLKYSIKSSLGSPATLLNSSKHTDFLYSIEGLDSKYIDEINLINTRTKLLDRINFIQNNGGKINFEKIIDPIFDYNLKMIDSKMPKFLADMLLKSYLTNKKDLFELFIETNQYYDKNFAVKKLSDFLEGISFGFFPSIKWDGRIKVNGGLVIIRKNGSIVVLDLIYYRNEVVKYLMKETKIDSPSSSRYHMLELYQIPNDTKIYFKLNLQIRYKK